MAREMEINTLHGHTVEIFSNGGEPYIKVTDDVYAESVELSEENALKLKRIIEFVFEEGVL